jgi:hypothetical protein
VTQNLKELVVVLAISWLVFLFLRPIALRFGASKDFSRRRNIWFAVTLAAFLCPTFLAFCLVATPILILGGRKDTNPAAFYLLLLNVVPEFSWRVPMVGISYLVDLDFKMLLSLCVMVPAAVRLVKTGKQATPLRWGLVDTCLVAYLALTSIYFILPEISRGVLMTPTGTDYLRRTFESMVRFFVPYYVISRSCSTRREFQEGIVALCIACAVMAALATFESARHWLLFGDIRARWSPGYNAYLARGESLRAMASTIHPLTLGYWLALAFGLWRCLRPTLPTGVRRNSMDVLLWLGLLAAYSRGPWLGAVLIYFVYTALGGAAVSGLLKATGAAVLTGVAVALSPLGDKIERVIPFLGGNVDAQNITYRQQLLSDAWQIIQQSPILGDQRALEKMQDLRAAGIIDLMNGFVNVLLDNGFLGLSLYLLFTFIGIYKAWRITRIRAEVDTELAAAGASITACILGLMVMMWAGGLIVNAMCILVALALACSHIARSPQDDAGSDAIRVSPPSKSPWPAPGRAR